MAAAVSQDQAFADIILARASSGPIATTYESLKLLSVDGHFSLVFSAREISTGKQVVLKFLKPWANSYRKASFKREARVAEQLVGKQNVIQLAGEREQFDVDLVDQTTGMTMLIPCEFFPLEYARETLTHALFGKRRPRALYRRLELMRDVVKGVNRLHNAGYCHRDLKPDNILIVSPGVAKIGDLGTCRLHSGVDPISADYSLPIGDLNYAPPEMFNGGGNLTSLYLPGDWFSVGAIMFEAVTGQNLYLAIGLRGPHEIVNALVIGSDLAEYLRQVGSIAGRYPVPSTLDFAAEPWLAPMSEETHNAVSGLVRDLCHFDYRKRLSDFNSVMRRLDLAILRAKLDSPGWRRKAITI
jgi:serine/threonine protein kinase